VAAAAAGEGQQTGVDAAPAAAVVDASSAPAAAPCEFMPTFAADTSQLQAGQPLSYDELRRLQEFLVTRFMHFRTQAAVKQVQANVLQLQAGIPLCKN
jgi:hypothetical protein